MNIHKNESKNIVVFLIILQMNKQNFQVRSHRYSLILSINSIILTNINKK